MGDGANVVRQFTPDITPMEIPRRRCNEDIFNVGPLYRATVNQGLFFLARLFIVYVNSLNRSRRRTRADGVFFQERRRGEFRDGATAAELHNETSAPA